MQYASMQNAQAQKNMMMATQQHFNNLKGQQDAQNKGASAGMPGALADNAAGKQAPLAQGAGMAGKSTQPQNQVPKISSHPEAPKNVNKL